MQANFFWNLMMLWESAVIDAGGTYPDEFRNWKRKS